MVRQLLKSKRPHLWLAGWKLEVMAFMAAMGVAVAVVPPITGVGDVAAARVTRATAPFSRLAAVPSHNGVYRASLVAPSDPISSFGPRAWTVEVQTATGSPVDDATLALESWMPEDDRVLATRPRVTGTLGDGHYRVEGVRFDRHGWWNVRLLIDAPGGTDSLAFNLVR